MNANKAIKDFIDGYFATNVRQKKTKSAYSSDLEQFKRFFGAGFDISKLAYTDIEQWAAILRIIATCPHPSGERSSYLKSSVHTGFVMER